MSLFHFTEDIRDVALVIHIHKRMHKLSTNNDNTNSRLTYPPAYSPAKYNIQKLIFKLLF